MGLNNHSPHDESAPEYMVPKSLIWSFRQGVYRPTKSLRYDIDSKTSFLEEQVILVRPTSHPNCHHLPSARSRFSPSLPLLGLEDH